MYTGSRARPSSTQHDLLHCWAPKILGDSRRFSEIRTPAPAPCDSRPSGGSSQPQVPAQQPERSHRPCQTRRWSRGWALEPGLASHCLQHFHERLRQLTGPGAGDLASPCIKARHPRAYQPGRHELATSDDTRSPALQRSGRTQPLPPRESIGRARCSRDFFGRS